MANNNRRRIRRNIAQPNFIQQLFNSLPGIMSPEEAYNRAVNRQITRNVQPRNSRRRRARNTANRNNLFRAYTTPEPLTAETVPTAEYRPMGSSVDLAYPTRPEHLGPIPILRLQWLLADQTDMQWTDSETPTSELNATNCARAMNIPGSSGVGRIRGQLSISSRASETVEETSCSPPESTTTEESSTVVKDDVSESQYSDISSDDDVVLIEDDSKKKEKKIKSTFTKRSTKRKQVTKAKLLRSENLAGRVQVEGTSSTSGFKFRKTNPRQILSIENTPSKSGTKLRQSNTVQILSSEKTSSTSGIQLRQKNMKQELSAEATLSTSGLQVAQKNMREEILVEATSSTTGLQVGQHNMVQELSINPSTSGLQLKQNNMEEELPIETSPSTSRLQLGQYNMRKDLPAVHPTSISSERQTESHSSQSTIEESFSDSEEEPSPTTNIQSSILAERQAPPRCLNEPHIANSYALQHCAKCRCRMRRNQNCNRNLSAGCCRLPSVPKLPNIQLTNQNYSAQNQYMTQNLSNFHSTQNPYLNGYWPYGPTIPINQEIQKYSDPNQYMIPDCSTGYSLRSQVPLPHCQATNQSYLRQTQYCSHRESPEPYSLEPQLALPNRHETNQIFPSQNQHNMPQELAALNLLGLPVTLLDSLVINEIYRSPNQYSMPQIPAASYSPGCSQDESQNDSQDERQEDGQDENQHSMPEESVAPNSPTDSQESYQRHASQNQYGMPKKSASPSSSADRQSANQRSTSQNRYVFQRMNFVPITSESQLTFTDGQSTSQSNRIQNEHIRPKDLPVIPPSLKAQEVYPDSQLTNQNFACEASDMPQEFSIPYSKEPEKELPGIQEIGKLICFQIPEDSGAQPNQLRPIKIENILKYVEPPEPINLDPDYLGLPARTKICGLIFTRPTKKNQPYLAQDLYMTHKLPTGMYAMHITRLTGFSNGRVYALERMPDVPDITESKSPESEVASSGHFDQDPERSEVIQSSITYAPTQATAVGYSNQLPTMNEIPYEISDEEPEPSINTSHKTKQPINSPVGIAGESDETAQLVNIREDCASITSTPQPRPASTPKSPPMNEEAPTEESPENLNSGEEVVYSDDWLYDVWAEWLALLTAQEESISEEGPKIIASLTAEHYNFWYDRRSAEYPALDVGPKESPPASPKSNT